MTSLRFKHGRDNLLVTLLTSCLGLASDEWSCGESPSFEASPDLVLEKPVDHGVSQLLTLTDQIRPPVNMATLVPPPDVRLLLPPLLACLPTAFASCQPPPALSPLLSPILQQRVRLLSATADTPTDSWLPLLCWEPGAAEKLPSLVQSEAFESHPVSGEIEFGEAGPIEYRRLDEETLQAKVDIKDIGLTIVYTWCHGSEEENHNSWRVAEVSPLDTRSEHATLDWCPSISIAETKAKEVKAIVQDVQGTAGPRGMVRQASGREDVEMNGNHGADEHANDEDEDDYWAQYDKTPGRTPATHSPLPGLAPRSENRGRSASEAAYFEQYSQVQPEMDNDDPSEYRTATGESSLNGNVMADAMKPSLGDHSNGTVRNPPYIHRQSQESASFVPLELVPPSENSAAAPSASETAIKQHVSTSIKSLFRLCRNAGIERAEFDELVHTELETLSMMAEDD